MEKWLRKYMPKYLKVKLRNVYQFYEQKHRMKENSLLPKHKLSLKHLSNLRSLVDRESLLSYLPKNGVVAEGAFSTQTLDICNPKRCYLIDSWNSKRYSIQMKEQLAARFESHIKQGRGVIKRGDSVELSSNFSNQYFDWIYLDTNHSYATTKKELEAYRSKIKQDGIIAGHDFMQSNWLKGICYGVIEAVYKFCVDYDWELIYLTMDFEEYPSLAVRRIRN